MVTRVNNIWGQRVTCFIAEPDHDAALIRGLLEGATTIDDATALQARLRPQLEDSAPDRAFLSQLAHFRIVAGDVSDNYMAMQEHNGGTLERPIRRIAAVLARVLCVAAWCRHFSLLADPGEHVRHVILVTVAMLIVPLVTVPKNGMQSPLSMCCYMSAALAMWFEDPRLGRLHRRFPARAGRRLLCEHIQQTLAGIRAESKHVYTRLMHKLALPADQGKEASHAIQELVTAYQHYAHEWLAMLIGHQITTKGELTGRVRANWWIQTAIYTDSVAPVPFMGLAHRHNVLWQTTRNRVMVWRQRAIIQLNPNVGQHMKSLLNTFLLEAPYRLPSSVEGRLIVADYMWTTIILYSLMEIHYVSITKRDTLYFVANSLMYSDSVVLLEGNTTLQAYMDKMAARGYVLDMISLIRIND